jgi:glycerol-3-phosphate acyltransferase PlsY
MVGTSLAFALGGYLLGSLPTGLLVGRILKGVDIREYGSGKTGVTNTLRTLGWGPAAVVLVCDVLKGVVPVLLAQQITDGAWAPVAAALGAIAGHDWPLYAGFRGGRGVATSFGATAALLPALTPVMLLIGALILLPWRYVSLMSVLGTAITAVILLALVVIGWAPVPYAAFALVAGPLIVVLHRDNIRRLLAGTEPKIGQGGGRRPANREYAHAGGRSGRRHGAPVSRGGR